MIPLSASLALDVTDGSGSLLLVVGALDFSVGEPTG